MRGSQSRLVPLVRRRITWGLAGVLLALACGAPARDRTVEGHAAVAVARAEWLAIVSPVSGVAQIVLISRDGSRRRYLTRGPEPSMTPVWAPDGRRLCFVRIERGRVRVYVVGVNRSPSRITSGPGDALLPAWSPDGAQIVFERRFEHESQIARARPDGTGYTVLTRLPGRATAPVWSPDGRFIAFVLTPPGGSHELRVMGRDGSGPRRIIAGPLLLRPGALHPVWSPDGREIAVVQRVGLAEQQITVVKTDGTGERRFATGYAPAWSPNGRWIAFVVARVGDAHIYRAEAHGASAVRLTRVGVNLLPAWSPDGRWIAFLSSRDGDLAVWVMNADGSGQRRLAPAYGDLSMLPVVSWRPAH